MNYEPKSQVKNKLDVNLQNANGVNGQGIENLSKIGKFTGLRLGLLVVCLFLFSFVLALIAQLFRLQMVEGENYEKIAAANHFKRKIVYPERGKIQDANGEILAMTTYVYTIGITPSIVKSYLPDLNVRPSVNDIANKFAEILQIPIEDVKNALQQKDKPYVQLAKEVERDVYEELNNYVKTNRISGIAFDIVDRRYYPNKDLASAVIGYANRQTNWISGVTGLEKYYDKELSGEAGYSFGEVDHYTEKQLPYSNAVEKPAVDGKNIVLHLNLELEKYVQAQVEKFAALYDCQEGGGAIVMNAKTGAILAMAQARNYDLNNPLAKPSGLINPQDPRVIADRDFLQKQFDLQNKAYDENFQNKIKPLEEKLKDEELSESDKVKIKADIKSQKDEFEAFMGKRRKAFEKNMDLTKLPDPDNWNPNEHENDMYFLNNFVWQNEMVSTPYEPGSTFKVFTVSSALEEHVISQNEVFSDAPIFVPGWDAYPISCWYAPNNHGWETAEQGLWRSCNPIMVQIAERLGIEKFQKYIKALGFYELTGIDLPFEQIGIMHDHLQFVDMATLSFGEQNTVTPIQLITAYTAITNNGIMMKPHMLKYITDKNGRIYKEYAPEALRQVYSRETAERMLAMLRGAVTHGLVEWVDVPGLQVGGKTGTSTKQTNETRPREDGLYDDNYSVNSTVAVFPVSDPQYIVMVMLKNPRTNISVAPQSLARNIIRETARIMNVKKVYAPGDIDKLLKTKPLSVQTGVSLTTLADYLMKYDFDYKLEPGLKPTDPFYTSYPPVGTVFNGYPILYISKDGSPPNEEIEVPDFSGYNFIQAAEYAYLKRVNIVYDGDPRNGVVVKQSMEAYNEDGTPNKMIPYSLITLTFAPPADGRTVNDFEFRDDPRPEKDIDLPVRYLFKRQTYSDWNALTPKPEDDKEN